jgi:hypothetical protein
MNDDAEYLLNRSVAIAGKPCSYRFLAGKKNGAPTKRTVKP